VPITLLQIEHASDSASVSSGSLQCKPLRGVNPKIRDAARKPRPRQHSGRVYLFIRLPHRPEILVKPIQRFLDELVAREVVAGVVEQVLFLVVARSEESKERLLR
jgi:hypothetical protein